MRIEACQQRNSSTYTDCCSDVHHPAAACSLRRMVYAMSVTTYASSQVRTYLPGLPQHACGLFGPGCIL